METNENHELTKAEGCCHCKPLVRQRDELSVQVERLRGDCGLIQSAIYTKCQTESLHSSEAKKKLLS